MKTKKEKKEHYVDNAEFSAALMAYKKDCKAKEELGEPTPMVTDYIAECFLKIAKGVSCRANFVRYTYKDEMVMDAVENCLKAVKNYDIESPTRTGKPNAFGYFTQISWYAFLRRIQKESKEQDIKMELLASSQLEEFLSFNGEVDDAKRAVQLFVDNLRKNIDESQDKVEGINAMSEQPKRIRRKRKSYDSDLTDFYDE